MTRRESEAERLERMHRIEHAAWAEGVATIGGIDEVGRGPLAGPVVAACVVVNGPLMLRGLNDSKRVTARNRERLAAEIRSAACGVGVGAASVEEIDRLSIGVAVRLAMTRALAAVASPPNLLLIDALRLPAYAGEQRAIIDGDARSAVIAAASIVAKVHRDALLVTLDREDPRYGFAAHKGYGTRRHLEALELHGASGSHRTSFAPVRRSLTR